WLQHSLHALDEALRKLRSRLIIAEGHSALVLAHLCRKYKIKTIYCSDSFDPVCQAADAEVESHLNDQHIALKIVNSTLLARPNTLKTKSDLPYRVFTPFGRAMVDQGFATVDKLPDR